MSSETKAQPTPGEWKAQPAEGRDTDWWDIVVPHFEYPGGKTLAAYIENEADARLMASAPELRDALRALTAKPDEWLIFRNGLLRCRFCDYVNEWPTKGNNHKDDCPIAQARRVLASLDVVD